MSKQQALRKVQVAIDKMVDLSTNVDNRIGGKVERILDSLRELEMDIERSKSKGGIITSEP